MSGGSFNYLCYKEFEHFVSYQVGSEAKEMADELEALGYPDLAALTIGMKHEAERLIETYEPIINALSHAWKGVEWWRSCDWSEEQAREWCDKAREELRGHDARSRAADLRWLIAAELADFDGNAQPVGAFLYEADIFIQRLRAVGFEIVPADWAKEASANANA